MALAGSPATCTTLVQRISSHSVGAVSGKYLPIPEFKLAAAARLLAAPSRRTVAPKLSAEDFQIFQLVGSGAQGTVALALYKPNGRFYGLKMTYKKSLSPRQLAFAFQEQAILEQLEGCPWFIQLRGSFEDSKYLYLVTVRSGFLSRRAPSDCDCPGLLHWGRAQEEDSQVWRTAGLPGQKPRCSTGKFSILLVWLKYDH